MSKEIPVLNASKATDAECCVMEGALTIERISTSGGVTTERRAELNGYMSKEVLDSALDMMKKLVDE